MNKFDSIKYLDINSNFYYEEGDMYNYFIYEETTYQIIIDDLCYTWNYTLTDMSTDTAIRKNGFETPVDALEHLKQLDINKQLKLAIDSKEDFFYVEED